MRCNYTKAAWLITLMILSTNAYAQAIGHIVIIGAVLIFGIVLTFLYGLLKRSWLVGGINLALFLIWGAWIWNVISTMSTHEYPDIFSIIVLIITVHTILLFVLVTAKIFKIAIKTIANSVKHFRSCNPDNK